MGRNSSPPGGSILMTRAPRPASNVVPTGAASHVEKSRMVMPSRGGADGGAPSTGGVRGRRSGGGSASCWPSSGAGAPMTDGVSLNLISGPICRVAPAAGSSISTTPPLCSTTGWSMACWVLMILSAATPFS